jgi:hypothetical protein
MNAYPWPFAFIAQPRIASAFNSGASVQHRCESLLRIIAGTPPSIQSEDRLKQV